MKLPVYLDYNATTPVDPRVLERMIPYFTGHYGNASSKGHAYGWAAAEGVKIAREELARLMNARPEALYFTGGATESINTAIKGIATTFAKKGNHIITVPTEHKAVLQSCEYLEKQGVGVTRLSVDVNGVIDLHELEDAITEQTILVSIMWANNETGVIQPIKAISDIVRSRDILFMTDGTQALGKIPVDVDDVDIFACTAHKLYGPKGVGALYARRRNPRVRLVPLVHGGAQEEGMRGGTLNVPGIVGFGAAANLASEEMEEESVRLAGLRDAFESMIKGALADVHINGGSASRLPHVSNLSFKGVASAKLVTQIRELAVSTGSACSTGTGKPSHVLKAMGLSDDEAYSSLRISFGRFSTQEEVNFAAEKIISAVNSLRRDNLVTNHF